MQHLDEGTIHAWLDGALPAEEAARVERHRTECATCAALVAEARGLVAGASRILSALDDAPSVVPGAGSGLRVAASGSASAGIAPAGARSPGHAAAGSRLPALRWWSRPATLAAAAGIVLMVGTAVVYNEGARPVARGVADETFAAPPTTEAADASSGAAGIAGPAGPAGPAGAAAPAPAAPAVIPDRAATPAGGVAGNVPLATGPVAGANLSEARRATEPASRRRQRTLSAPVTAQREAGSADSTRIVPPPSPVPGARAEGAVAKAAAPAPSLALSDVVVTAAPSGPDSAAPRRAAARRAERAMPVPSAGLSVRSATRGDTVFESRVDTVRVPGRTDTVVVEPPAPPGLRAPGQVRATFRPFTVTGCYQVLQGGPPDSLTLTGTSIWSGVAEQRFLATTKGARGYWSQVRRGDIHLVITGVLVTARIDPSTGELRGKVQRGGRSEPFVARRGCR